MHRAANFRETKMTNTITTNPSTTPQTGVVTKKPSAQTGAAHNIDAGSKFKVIVTRPKAHRLEAADGTKFWIKKAWRREDGSFTPAVQSSYQRAVDEQAQGKALVPINVDWESDKAVGMDYCGEFVLDPTLVRTCNLRPKRVRVFFPKSMMTDGKVPLWFLVKKRCEAAAKLPKGFDLTDAWNGEPEDNTSPTASTDAPAKETSMSADHTANQNFTIVETRDGEHLLVSDEGIRFWVDTEWVRADGTFTQDVYDAFRDADEEQGLDQHITVPFEPTWETDDALGLDYRAKSPYGGPDIKASISFPKSVVTDGRVTLALFKQKVREAEAELPAGYAFKKLWEE